MYILKLFNLIININNNLNNYIIEINIIEYINILKFNNFYNKN